LSSTDSRQDILCSLAAMDRHCSTLSHCVSQFVSGFVGLAMAHDCINQMSCDKSWPA